MTATTAVAGELPKGDPALLNRVAWNCRWSSREKSRTFAKAALNMIGHPPPKRPESAYGYALTTLAWQAKWRGGFGVAMTQGLDAETHLSEAAHPCARAHIYSILGVLHYSKNRLDLAANSVERGLSLASPDDHTDAYIDLLTTKATVKRLNGDRS